MRLRRSASSSSETSMLKGRTSLAVSTALLMQPPCLVGRILVRRPRTTLLPPVAAQPAATSCRCQLLACKPALQRWADARARDGKAGVARRLAVALFVWRDSARGERLNRALAVARRADGSSLYCCGDTWYTKGS